MSLTNSATDEVRLQMLLAQNLRRNSPTSKTYTAHWLKEGGIGSAVWKTITPGGKTQTVSFQHPLPDGTLLTDSENTLLLHSVQKYAFELRRGSITGLVMSTARWYYTVSFAQNIASWAVLHEDLYTPRISGFTKIDQNAVLALVEELAEGGLSGALQYRERLIIFFHDQLKHGCNLQSLLEKPDQLDNQFVSDVIKWLSEHGHYKRVISSFRRNGATLSRGFLCTTLGIKQSATSGDARFRHFIRQFEPGLQHPYLLIPSIIRTNFPSQNILEMSEASSLQTTLGNFGDYLDLTSNFFMGHSIMPDLLPKIELDKTALILQHSSKLGMPAHTPLIPLSIGLQAIREACRWVIYYGKTIVEAATFYAAESTRLHKMHDNSTAAKEKPKLFLLTRENWLTTPPDGSTPVSLHSIFHLDKLQPTALAPRSGRYRDLLSVIDAFVGACALIIGMLKPLRAKELAHLSRACLGMELNGEGCFLHHEQGKSGRLDSNNFVGRPIPGIAAQAIQLLQLMGSQLSDIYGDTSSASDKLFYFPAFGFRRSPDGSMEDRVDKCINTFCDMIETPVDNKGRRWYLRVHEMRKFFLLVMHRHEGDHVTSMLGYGAAHKDKKHTKAYIAPDEDYDAFVIYESECIEDRLVSLEAGRLAPAGRQGLSALYNHLLSRFGVSSLSSMPKTAFTELVKGMHGHHEFLVSTYTVHLENYPNEVVSIDFAVKFGDKQDEKFDG